MSFHVIRAGADRVRIGLGYSCEKYMRNNIAVIFQASTLLGAWYGGRESVTA